MSYPFVIIQGQKQPLNQQPLDAMQIEILKSANTVSATTTPSLEIGVILDGQKDHNLVGDIQLIWEDEHIATLSPIPEKHPSLVHRTEGKQQILTLDTARSLHFVQFKCRILQPLWKVVPHKATVILGRIRVKWHSKEGEAIHAHEWRKTICAEKSDADVVVEPSQAYKNFRTQARVYFALNTLESNCYPRSILTRTT